MPAATWSTTIDATDDPAPDILSGLDEAELKKLQAILGKLTAK